MPPAKASRTPPVSHKAPHRRPKLTGGTESFTQRTPRLEHHCANFDDLQRLLDVFCSAFPDLLDSRCVNERNALLQQVKGHLFRRDFEQAFAKQDFLKVYAIRWSASRALAYYTIFTDLAEYLRPALAARRSPTILCLGGGAGAELMALRAVSNAIFCQSEISHCTVACLDKADWSVCIDSLDKAWHHTWPSASTSHRFTASFAECDVLSISGHSALPLRYHVRSASLITIMFTLNELYSTSLAQTQTFLLNMTSSTPEGTLLLVVDSPGSYSTVTIAGNEKRYPMSWLLDHTLMKSASQVYKSGHEANDGISTCWEKLIDSNSRWFRLPAALSYPIDLESMRYQLHLYRRLAT